MRTLVLEPMPELFWQEINKNGWDSYFDSLQTDSPAEIEVVIMRTGTQFVEKKFEQYPNLKMIIRAGSGFDNIDVDEADRRGVVVCNTPEANVLSAYEHTVSKIFALIKHHQEGKKAVLDGSWKTTHSANWEIADLKVLVVGVGRVGTRVAQTLQYLGAEVRGVDPYLSEEDWKNKGIIPYIYRDGLQWCNMITYHCPLSKETRHYFSGQVLEELNHPVWLVNVARGSVLEMRAVEAGIENGKLLGAGIDVFPEEPWDPKLFAHFENVFITPHTGAFTDKAKQRLSMEALDVWSRFVFKSEVVSEIDRRFF